MFSKNTDMIFNYSNPPILLEKIVTKKFETVPKQISKLSERYGFKTPVIWKLVIVYVIFHIAALYGLYLLICVGTWKTFLWINLLIAVGNLGITAGSHRLWTHRTYKANLPLRIIFMLMQTVAGQKSIYDWVRDHRVHHKYPHTNADPHNPERGYFFAHIGWLMMKKHDEVVEKGNGIDLSDLEADPVTRFQRRFYPALVVLTGFLFPALVPWYFWGESQWVCLFVPTFFRFVTTLNLTLLVNSLSHFYGSRPYDKTIGPADNVIVSFFALGEGFHNYHHVFPWDYKTGEFGGFELNVTTLIIDFFAAIGWAYDLKTASEDMINNRKIRTGDNRTSYRFKEEHHPHLKAPWPWNDEDVKADDVKIYNKLHEE